MEENRRQNQKTACSEGCKKEEKEGKDNEKEEKRILEEEELEKEGNGAIGNNSEGERKEIKK